MGRPPGRKTNLGSSAFDLFHLLPGQELQILFEAVKIFFGLGRHDDSVQGFGRYYVIPVGSAANITHLLYS
jgi:hypothetical protein